MKRIVLGMVLGFSIIAAPVMAKTFDLGDVTGADYSNYEKVKVPGGSLDTYNFTLSKASMVYISLTDTAQLTGLKTSLYGVGDGPLGSDTLKTMIGPLNDDRPFGDWQSTSTLAAGNYRINVVGNYASVGQYTLTMNSQVPAPVPGPAGIIVAGAGALVVAARKRRKVRSAAAA